MGVNHPVEAGVLSTVMSVNKGSSDGQRRRNPAKLGVECDGEMERGQPAENRARDLQGGREGICQRMTVTAQTGALEPW